MEIKFVCKKCGQNIEIDEACAGQTVQCPTCKASLAVPKKIRIPAAVPPTQPPSPQAPVPVRKNGRPILKIAAALIVVAVLLGDYWGYTFWQARKKAKADAQLVIRDGKQDEQAKTDAQLAAVKAALEAITSEVARVETQLTVVRTTLDETTAKVANVESQLASVKTALDDKPAKNDGPQQQTPYSPSKKKRKKK